MRWVVQKETGSLLAVPANKLGSVIYLEPGVNYNYMQQMHV